MPAWASIREREKGNAGDGLQGILGARWELWLSALAFSRRHQCCCASCRRLVKERGMFDDAVGWARSKNATSHWSTRRITRREVKLIQAGEPIHEHGASGIGEIETH